MGKETELISIDSLAQHLIIISCTFSRRFSTIFTTKFSIHTVNTLMYKPLHAVDSFDCSIDKIPFRLCCSWSIDIDYRNLHRYNMRPSTFSSAFPFLFELNSKFPNSDGLFDLFFFRFYSCLLVLLTLWKMSTLFEWSDRTESGV